ncbi:MULTISPECIES: glycosyltransferase [Edwardsiella]|uniref:Glycosyltransferase n=4 Tax=Edwardsiella TaxID=635 RepID=A0A076LNX6_9GAMM|nr:MULTISPECIES: glycosyltransferase [Edwardsiella]GAJ66479.1 glycosyltransferase [Edwardsiella piscicida]AIJ09571.1 Glycosyltransferase [Edwardsiella anguillarum ET080813]KAB0592549.1 glycosyltransferase [Edwardsiella anguillarum]RFT01919.1 glycosyl transferase [Edwardsiella anguillarum]UBU94939.1 glycosyltransferase [Edwardsiella sp. LADL05-105]
MIELNQNNVHRVCFVITGLGMGGAEKQVCDLADKLSLRGVNVIVISLADGVVVQPLLKDVKVYSINMKKNIFGFIRALWRVRRIIKGFNPQVVHSHMYHANLFSRFLRVLDPSFKLICTAHNTNEGGRWRMLSYRLTDWLASISTNVSQEAVTSFEQANAVKKGRMILMYNGVNTDKYKYSANERVNKRRELSLSNDDVLILAVGRLTEAKNYKNLLSAFSKIKCEGRSLVLAIAGIGEDKASLAQLAIDLGIESSVRWLGLRYDVAELMSAMDIYVMSSSWEGMPLVLCEAMSCGGVVVSTDCGGTKEIVGDAGFLVPKADSMLLASALKSAIDLTPEQREIISDKARDRILTRYSLCAVSDEWMQLYNKVV